VKAVVGALAVDDDAADPVGAGRDLAAELGMRLVDAGVDDADSGTAGRREAAETGRVPALGRVDVRISAAAGLARVVEAVEL
jgi:hypothetical protein